MKTKPQKHQQEIYEQTKKSPYHGYLLEQGLGKSKITIDVANYLAEDGEINGVLVLAPNGVHLNWLYEELPKHSWHFYKAVAWKSSARKKEREAIAKIQKPSECFRWFLMNIEAIRTNKGYLAAKKFLESGTMLMVIDESTVIKSPKAIQTRAALRLGELAKYRRILTGTPMTQGPLDLFTQIRFLNKAAIPITSYTAFKRTFAIEERMCMGNRQFNKIVGYRNLDYLRQLIKNFTIRLNKEDCTDLPEKIYQKQYVELTKDQERVYKQIKEQQVAMLEQEEATVGMVSVTSALAALVKLQQVCVGFLIDDVGDIHDVSNNRFDALALLTQDTTEKYVIWCHFRHSVESVQRFLEQRHGKEAVVSYYGKTSQDERVRAVRDFNSRDNVRFFVANRAASKGLTLTGACRAIYFAHSYSLEDRLQSEDRIHRIGQRRTCFYVDLMTRGTVEESIVKALSTKKELSDKVITSDWRSLINDTN